MAGRLIRVVFRLRDSSLLPVFDSVRDSESRGHCGLPSTFFDHKTLFKISLSPSEIWFRSKTLHKFKDPARETRDQTSPPARGLRKCVPGPPRGEADYGAGNHLGQLSIGHAHTFDGKLRAHVGVTVSTELNMTEVLTLTRMNSGIVMLASKHDCYTASFSQRNRSPKRQQHAFPSASPGPPDLPSLQRHKQDRQRGGGLKWTRRMREYRQWL